MTGKEADAQISVAQLRRASDRVGCEADPIPPLWLRVLTALTTYPEGASGGQWQ